MFINQQVEIDTLPQISSVELKPISKNYFMIIILNKIVIYIIITGVFVAAKFKIQEEAFHDYFFYIVGMVIIGCLLNVVVSLLAFKKRKYAIRDKDVIYSKGLIVNSITTVPISRIQHIEESRSWLARQLNLATLKIFTAGESGSDLKIDGLPQEEARQINDFLSTRVNENN
ncbi:MAG: membrane protein YdbS with pleckstrin-like domain [Psychroserpens sp.]|jgi:membrane protein YdbS with pleckstrin-like domain|uniref:PH domain-containing protein n=1 Tax=Psychroserpens sp. TaxID=2020870 RepID=UPI0039E3B363